MSTYPDLMITQSPDPAALSRWDGLQFRELDYCDPSDATVLAADSWRVEDGRTLGLDLHRARFAAAAEQQGHPVPDGLWPALVSRIPSTGSWFPRIDLEDAAGASRWLLRVRPAPARQGSVTLATAEYDPRRDPQTKGPDLAALLGLRAAAQTRGATEAVILSPDGAIVDGSTSALVWWEADALCVPEPALLRTDSITARVILTLAGVFDVDVLHERRRPEELAGREIWAVNALHGIRIVTDWVDGPAPAQEPGRLRLWRDRLGALVR